MQEKQKKLRYQVVRIRDLEHSRAAWKQRAIEAEAALHSSLERLSNLEASGEEKT